MVQTMHNEIERTILNGDQDFKPLRNFARVMKAHTRRR